MSAFQAEYAGSIPATRSSVLPIQSTKPVRYYKGFQGTLIPCTRSGYGTIPATRSGLHLDNVEDCAQQASLEI